MKFLGIDYGDKKVGLATSDEEGSMAFSKGILENTSSLVKDIENIVKSENIDAVVIGESRNFEGKENVIMKRIKPFKESLEKALNKPVYFEPELFSSQEAKRGQEDVRIVDDGAATIILQSYLDKQNN